jgi:hypothetical protein
MWKLAESATQAVCRGLMSKNVGLLGYWVVGEGGGVHNHLLSGNGIFPVRSLRNMVLRDIP